MITIQLIGDGGWEAVSVISNIIFIHLLNLIVAAFVDTKSHSSLNAESTLSYIRSSVKQIRLHVNVALRKRNHGDKLSISIEITHYGNSLISSF